MPKSGNKTQFHESASQTAGPYVHIGLTPNFSGIKKVYPEDLGKNRKSVSANAISITGTIYDGSGAPVRDCLIEFSQADENGNTRLAPVGGKGFSGFNRIPINLADGSYTLSTIKPGRVLMADGNLQSPHLTLWIAARGINIGLHTRLYFDDEADANKSDPILNLVSKSRRKTLIARKVAKNKYEFDIRLQGADETVFFDV
jgi:protocatechuate 3,4-dioxygenase alpha subunit